MNTLPTGFDRSRTWRLATTKQPMAEILSNAETVRKRPPRRATMASERGHEPGDDKAANLTI